MKTSQVVLLAALIVGGVFGGQALYGVWGNSQRFDRFKAECKNDDGSVIEGTGENARIYCYLPRGRHREFYNRY